MLNAFRSLDRVLRGESTQPQALRDASLDVPVPSMLLAVVVLAMAYGVCMGSYSVLKEVDSNVVGPNDRYLQVAATTIKVPALFILTLVVTFPSLYVFNALVGSRLTLPSVLRLLVAGLGVNLAVLASLGPIVAFFSLTTRSYSFVVLMNVFVFFMSGVLGCLFLIQTLNRMIHSRQFQHGKVQEVGTAPLPALADSENSQLPSGAEYNASAGVDSPTPTDDSGTNDHSPIECPPGHALVRHTKLVFTAWIVLFGVVGAQMGWVLRPFIGNPNQPFSWFRERDSNFFESVLFQVASLLVGGD